MTDCVAEEVVVDLLEGRLDDTEIERVTAHLDGCDACREIVAAAARAVELPAGAAATTTASAARGTCVGRYVVLDRIGIGSMGVVYAAYDPELNRRVALKLLRTDAFASTQPLAELRARLIREAQALAQLSHPNVITVHDVGTHEGEVFLAMEFAAAGTLADWLHAEKRLTHAILGMFRQAGLGLAAAHDAGIVHRDFKPENVLVGQDGRVFVSDFGLARSSGGDAPLAPSPDRASDSTRAAALTATATRTGALIGTPAYMAPEQWQGLPSDARADVFAFSVALYEALYGERPFAGDTPADLGAAIARNEVRSPPRSGGPGRGAGDAVPGSVRRALLRGLRANPDERFASMRSLLVELAPSRPRTRIALGLLAAATLLTAAVALGRPRPPPLCEGAALAWGDTFDATHEEAVHRVFLATSGPSADFAFATVRRALLDYRTSWIAMHTETCQSTRVRGQQSEALLDLRMRCLDERRHGAKALVRSLEAGGADLLERATIATLGLARIEDCADTRALTEPVPMPTDPAKRARLEALVARTAEVEAEAIGGKEALSAIEPLLAESKELGWSPLTARLLFDHAFRQSSQRNNREAEIELHEAAIRAEEARADAVAFDAWSRLAFVVGYQEHRVAEGLLWGRYAEAAMARVGGGDDRDARLSGYVALVLMNDESRLEDAHVACERALELAKKTSDPESFVVARAKGRLALVLLYLGHSEQALPLEHDARAIYERLLGPENLYVAISLQNEGDGLTELGRIDEALAILQRSSAMEERLGRNNESVLIDMAVALRRKGQPDAALAVDRRALALVEKNEAPDSYELATPLVGIALDLLDLGRPREALPFAERAAKLRSETTAPSERGQARFALARGLWGGGERGRALEIAKQARDDCRPTAESYGGRYRATLNEIDAWLAVRSK